MMLTWIWPFVICWKLYASRSMFLVFVQHKRALAAGDVLQELNIFLYVLAYEIYGHPSPRKCIMVLLSPC